jgi:hypothetical protein
MGCKSSGMCWLSSKQAKTLKALSICWIWSVWPEWKYSGVGKRRRGYWRIPHTAKALCLTLIPDGLEVSALSTKCSQVYSSFDTSRAKPISFGDI